MAGTLFGLGLSQQFDANGDPLAGALLYIYAANSSTPSTVYKDVGLTAGNVHTWPLVADANGRIPAFWVADGSYRARLTDDGGVPQFDEAYMLAIGPSTGAPALAGTDANGTMTTGDVKWRAQSGELQGWVRLHGGTVGNLLSGSTYQGDQTTNYPLFNYLWTTFPQSICPVLTSGGTVVARDPSNSLNDFNNNRRITLLDMRGRTPFGFSDMGQTDSLRLAGALFGTGNATTIGSTGGEATHTLTFGELAKHAHDVTDNGHVHDLAERVAGSINPSNADRPLSGSGGSTATQPGGNSGVNSHTSDISIPATGTGASTPQGNAHNTMPPFMVGTWYMRL
jgi:hypothetical protein